MKITEKQLRRVMPLIERNLRANRHFRGMTVGQVAELMNKYAEEFDIITPLQWVHYLAQVAHESAQLRYTEELASGAAYDTGNWRSVLAIRPRRTAMDRSTRAGDLYSSQAEVTMRHTNAIVDTTW